MGKKITKDSLTLKEERFCQIFAKDRDCFGNGTQAYIKAFSTRARILTDGTVRGYASDLLTKPNIINRIRELIDIYISNEVVDKELGTVVLQYGDLSSKVAAIREYNRIKGRLAPTQVKFIDDNEDLNDDQINEQIAAREKKSGKPA